MTDAGLRATRWERGTDADWRSRFGEMVPVVAK
jgi:hypothetical protein